MPKRTTAIAAVVVLLFALTGCGEETAAPADEPKPFAAPLTTEEPPAPEASEEPELGYGPTAAGEVCDPQNLNDSICAAFYPDHAVLRIAARGGAIASLDPQQTLDLATKACDEMRAGNTWESSTLATGDDNRTLYTAAAVGYCPEYAPGKTPDHTARLIAFYQSLGEAGAKDHFADRVMPTDAELGY